MPNIKTEFPRTIRALENLFITLADGTRLAARMWLPVDAEQNPVPALLEYLPYRKNDGTTGRDSIRHPYFAGHGYACLRVDMRGSGDSDGILYDEYLKQEQDDALEVIAWIASQPWCTGGVGMFGISWGGFNALQVAARRPPALKAIITVCSTDDRYADDVHYSGGALLAYDMLPWAAVMFGYNAAPPDPRWAGDRWREMWFERMMKTPPYIEAWLTHQRRDAFWKHGSVCEDFSAIDIPVFAVGGWADGYPNAIPRLLAGLTAPRLGLIGPWAHNYPEAGHPAPAIGFLQESLRWWDHWLKDQDTGIMTEPTLRAYIMGSVPPQATYDERPGRWVAESAWPSTHIQAKVFALNAEGLSTTAETESTRTLAGLPATGMDMGSWCSYGLPGEAPADQRADDGKSLSFTSEPLDEDMDILGNPELHLALSVDQPVALVAARLCDIAPDGASTLVSWGVLNLTHRDSHEFPSALIPNQRYEIKLQLKVIGCTLPKGHRWRVSLSQNLWPMIWPAPRPVKLTVFTGASQLILPARPRRADGEYTRGFLPAETAPKMSIDVLRADKAERFSTHDSITGLTQLTSNFDYGRIRYPVHGLEVDNYLSTVYSIRADDPLSFSVRCVHNLEYQRGDWRVRVETVSVMTSDETHFIVTNTLDAYAGDTRVFAKTWDFKTPRDLV